MPAAAATATVARLLPYLAKAGPALRGLYQSKHFWPLLLGGGFLGQTALSETGKAGERGLTREQLQIQKLLAESQAVATRRTVEEAKAQAKEYTAALLKARKEERGQAREENLMETFMASQDRQMALIMQAMQGILQTQRPAYASGGSGGGIVGLMRSG